jgi:beta-glucosidase
MLFRRFVFLLLLAFAVFAQAQQPAYLDPSLSPAQRAHDLVGRMTLEE